MVKTLNFWMILVSKGSYPDFRYMYSITYIKQSLFMNIANHIYIYIYIYTPLSP